MAKKDGGRPLIAGGRTLSRALSGGKHGSSSGKGKKAKVWYAAGTNKGTGHGRTGSYPVVG